MLVEHLTRPARGAGPEHTVFHAASGKAIYRTVFVRGVFGPAHAALPAVKQGLRFHEYADLLAMPTRVGKSSQIGLMAA